MHTGQLYIFSAPSGAGKTSLIEALLKQTSDIGVSISHTTRDMRPGEEDGVHYHFIDKTEFSSMVDEGIFLEHATVFDNFYGTSQKALDDRLATGEDVIVEIDWQGAQQVRKKIPQALSVFILPPTREALKQRLNSRGQDSDEVIARRLQDATSDMGHFNEFDFVVINDDFEQATEQLRSVILAQRQRITVLSEKEEATLAALLDDSTD